MYQSTFGSKLTSQHSKCHRRLVLTRAKYLFCTFHPLNMHGADLRWEYFFFFYRISRLLLNRTEHFERLVFKKLDPFCNYFLFTMKFLSHNYFPIHFTADIKNVFIFQKNERKYPLQEYFATKNTDMKLVERVLPINGKRNPQVHSKWAYEF